MTGRVAGKVALITGGARGQGRAHGQLLAQEGATVVLADIRDELGQAAAGSLCREGLEVSYMHLDVTREDHWQRVVTDTERAYGRLDVLINNAGIVGSAADVVDETVTDWLRVLAVNQTGAFLGMKHSVPAMRRSQGGSIINVSSIWGLAAARDRIAYHATKGAILAMTRNVAVTYAREGIRANNVVPGSVQTDFGPDRPLRSPNTTIEVTPLARRAQPIEVSYAVLYLASDESAFVTGADLVVDGGYLAQ